VVGKILQITKCKKEDVYDLMVKNNHNFFANGVLVHNCGE
jgi:intein/homing endonuclease